MPTKGENRKGGEGWLLAYRYPHMDAAGRAYSAARDIVFSEDIDASVYRILVRGVPHVAVLGDGELPTALRIRFEHACADGEPTELPAHVRVPLVERRRAGRIPGAFWERRRL